MTVLVCAALAIFLAGAVVAARRLARIPTIRLVSTNQQPELTLHKGQTWHLFNSHIWFQQSMRLSRPLPHAGNLATHRPDRSTYDSDPCWRSVVFRTRPSPLSIGPPVKTPSQSSRARCSCYYQASECFWTCAAKGWCTGARQSCPRASPYPHRWTISMTLALWRATLAARRLSSSSCPRDTFGARTACARSARRSRRASQSSSCKRPTQPRVAARSRRHLIGEGPLPPRRKRAHPDSPACRSCEPSALRNSSRPCSTNFSHSSCGCASKSFNESP